MPEPILRVVRKHIGEAEIIVDAAPDDEKPLVDQFCILVKREDKLEALRRLIDSSGEFYGLVFCATKIETDELARRLVEAGYPAEAIHGDLSQEIRERTLRRFRLHRAAIANSDDAGGKPAILVATDVAARGLDIENLSHVINWDPPGDRETYLHRIGRTGRAGRRGTAISLATLADRGRIYQFSRMIEKNLGSGIQWLKVPSVKAVMKTLRRRIASTVVAALPGGELGIENAEKPEFIPAQPSELLPASPYLAKVCQNLVERLGAEKAVEALVLLNYGNLLDPARYGPITEFSEEDFVDTRSGPRGRGSSRGFGANRNTSNDERRRGRGFSEGRKRPARGENHRPAKSGMGEFVRLYVGQGRQHGIGARDIASLLMRVGGVPSRLVDEIEMKDYCSFASLPSDAAQNACAFSRKNPNEPVIRFAQSKHSDEPRATEHKK
jgi:ATP-dependent RNA helicase DeaD